MSQYIDWSGLPELETFCERSELNDFFKNKFLERKISIITFFKNLGSEQLHVSR